MADQTPRTAYSRGGESSERQALAEARAEVAGLLQAVRLIATRTINGAPCWCVSDDAPHEGWQHSPVCTLIGDELARLASPVPSALLDLRAPETVERMARAFAAASQRHRSWSGNGPQPQLALDMPLATDLVAALLAESEAPKPAGGAA